MRSYALWLKEFCAIKELTWFSNFQLCASVLKYFLIFGQNIKFVVLLRKATTWLLWKDGESENIENKVIGIVEKPAYLNF